MRIRELLDAEVLLHGSLGITQKRPRGTQRVAELVEVEWVVRAETTSRVYATRNSG